RKRFRRRHRRAHRLQAVARSTDCDEGRRRRRAGLSLSHGALAMSGRTGNGVRLAAGGHATVWLARSGEELIAKKQPHPHLIDDPDVRAALQREAEIALRLRHPNVVRLRGIELEEETPVLVMDYIDGAT